MRRFLVIASLLCFVLFACFEAPVGKPEDGRIEHRLDGFWFLQEKPGGEYHVVMVVPLDEHVDCLVMDTFTAEGERKPGETGVCRAWVTTIATYPFVSLEPMVQLLPEYDKKKWFVSARLTFRRDGTLGVQPLNDDYPGLKQEKDPSAVKRVIEANIDDPSLLDKSTDYHRPDLSNAVEKKIRDQLMN